MRSCIVFESDMTTEELSLVVSGRELNGRTLTSSCKVYASSGWVMLTAPQLYSLPRTWTPGDVRSITLSLTDTEAVAMTEYEWLLTHEVTE